MPYTQHFMNVGKKCSVFKPRGVMTQFALSLYSCQHYGIPYEGVIDEPYSGDIIKLIQLINILTT